MKTFGTKKSSCRLKEESKQLELLPKQDHRDDLFIVPHVLVTSQIDCCSDYTWDCP